MRASVHRWSPEPAASGPASSTDSSRASCCSSSRHRAAGPSMPARPGRRPATPAATAAPTARSPAAQQQSPQRAPAARTFPRPLAGPAPGACGPPRLTRHLAHTAYLLHTPGNRARQPLRHPELKSCMSGSDARHTDNPVLLMRRRMGSTSLKIFNGGGYW